MSSRISSIIDPLPRTQQARPFLYRFDAVLEIRPVGIVPEGLRLVVSFDGRISEGMLAGGRAWGIDHLLIRRDGVGVIDAHKTLSLGNVNVYEHVQAYCLPPEDLALPPLEVLLEPGFAWPERMFVVHGFSMFRAAHPELAFLNQAVGTIQGEASFAKRQVGLEIRLASPAKGSASAAELAGEQGRGGVRLA